MPLSQEELAILVTGKDVSATRVMRNVGKEADRFGTKLAGIGSKAGRNFARNLERTVIAGTAAAASAIAYSVKEAGNLDASLRTINTIARITTDGLGGVHDGLDDISDGIRAIARNTGTPLEELTQGYYDLLSAGIKAADAQGVLTAANALAIGGLATTAETVDLLTTAINTYGGDASKAGQYADFFAKAVERGKVTADEIAASFAIVGPIAASSGIEIQELAAGYARLTAAGVPGAEAATQMRSALVGLMKVTGPLAKLQKQTGTDYFKLAGKKGLVFALQQLRTDADKAGVPLIKLLGRVEGVNFALQTTGPNFAAYNADLASMGDSAGTAAAQMAERQQGLNFQLGRLKANVKDAAITIGSELLPVFADLAEEGTNWVMDHQPEIHAFAKDLAKGIRDAVDAAKELDWDAIADALKAGAGAAETIAGAFMALPTDVKGLLLGGYAVNKVTGGAVTDVAGLGLKTILSQFAARGSSPANPMFVSAIGGGLGGGLGGGAAAGGMGLLAGGAALAAVAAVELVVADQFGQWARAQPWWDTNVGPVHVGGASQSQAAHQQAVASMGPSHGQTLYVDPRGLSEGNRELVDHVDTVRDRLEANRIAILSGSHAVVNQTDAARDAIEANRIATVSAIARKDLSVTTHTNVDVKVPVVTNISVSDRGAVRHNTSAAAHVGRDESHHTGLGGA